jgi:hypothetical protein
MEAQRAVCAANCLSAYKNFENCEIRRILNIAKNDIGKAELSAFLQFVKHGKLNLGHKDKRG